MANARRQVALLTLLVSGQIAADSQVDVVEFSSGSERVALIELYTSEGCSSCPPADRWLSGLESDPGLWTSFAPIAFHVDYWDYIGWQDRFADARFSDRQRRYATEGGARSVYTPGVFANGRAWLDWRHGERIERDSAAAGSLTVRIEGQGVAARFDPASRDHDELVLHIALLGMDLETRVRAGENKGRTLRHDFVALAVDTVPFEKSGRAYRAITRVPGEEFRSQRLALVAWVSTRERQTPIQSVGGFLPAG